ncbi:hypothetical protein EZZ76_10190 [Neisseria meningitidis]|nr:hypothetical protein [Neisseria meningitidis]
MRLVRFRFFFSFRVISKPSFPRRREFCHSRAGGNLSLSVRKLIGKNSMLRQFIGLTRRESIGN